MDFDIPTDLIDKAQIGFRAAAGLSSFDRKYTTLPSISTVEASISSLDPSPSYLRCKSCQGKLLRGLQSLICIYCGENQKKDLHPDPISFNSTHGYSWLLQSLNFNGSERIGSLAEGSEINGGQSPAEDELTLSELLDLKISWQHEPEKLENNFNIKTSEHNSSLDLGTTDFDHFFSKSMQKSAIASDDVLEEQPVASKADQHRIIEGQENITSDWNAEFQFADTKKENEKLESVDLFEGAEADLSAHMDVAFGQTESFDFKKPNDNSDPFQDDLFANMGSATFQQNEQLDSVVQAKDGLSGDLNDFNSKNVDGDWFNDGNWQKSSVKSTLNDVSLQDNPNDSSTDRFENANWQKSSANNTATIKDDNYTLHDGSLQDNPNDISTDWFEDTNWQKVSTNNTTATIKEDNLFDSKPHANDLIQSEKPDLDNSDKHHSDITDWFQNSQWAIGGSSSTPSIVVSKDDDDDGFGEWNDFTNSTGNQDSWKESGNEKADFGTSEKMSELNLFQSAVNSQEVDFGNFLQSDIFSGDKNSNDTRAAYDIFSEASTAVRNANTEAGDNVEGSKNDEITPNATASLKDDVQMLMSQMHDLSFMLKNELSVPSKPDDIGSSHS
ncbi:hypothetical protein L1987_19342 [Smallanthus sonchifolius]|uniref:Uncharacterized protein n=1 Tax=Smallanthus sonchifolius TaxID=185202 RepID=A0ACB9IRQ3_9ASTR|nr:hypothetical protein L1987_19342 [Smallanthus sonchifolius]